MLPPYRWKKKKEAKQVIQSTSQREWFSSAKKSVRVQGAVCPASVLA
jgi:hypothetical protein